MERNKRLSLLHGTIIVALIYACLSVVVVASPDSNNVMTDDSRIIASPALKHAPISEVIFGGDVRGEYEETGVETDSWDLNAIKPARDYVRQQSVYNGKPIDKVVVPGSPPKFFRMSAVAVPQNYATQGVVVLPNVPAFDWSYGCSATSAAMIMGYYDNMGYSNMYAGPANGGVCPLNNTIWGYGECPLSATHMKYDGLLTKGHVDDYWRSNGNNDPDPYVGFWSEHVWAGCTADYMGTNQSKYGNSDGSTTFWYFTDGSPLYDYSGGEPSGKDGCHGMGEFAKSRGYQVATNFSQYIYGYNGNSLGFTFDQYKNEINNGRPVMIQVSGHSMVGYGYDSTNQTVYIHDTWDHNNHTMKWGADYAGMQQYGVTVVRLVSTKPLLTINQPYEYTWYVSQNVSSALSASGGVQPYHWSAIDNGGGYTCEVLGSSSFSTLGLGQGWNDDEGSWAYTLPFTFKYYGKNYTTVNVCSNGYMDFTNSSTDWGNSTTSLASRVCIAPLWDDLVTIPGDIFIDKSTAGQVTIRWQGVTWSGSNPVDFSATLFSDRRIRFDYGGGNTGLSPTIGVSPGNGSGCTLVGGYDGASSLTNAKSVLFTPYDGALPPGLSLDTATGILSGKPTTAGDYNVTIQVKDNEFLTQTAQQAFVLHILKGYTISGTVHLGDYVGQVLGVPVTVDLLKDDRVTIIRTEKTSLNAKGKVCIYNVPPGTYYVGIKPSHWLRRVFGPITVNNADVTF